MSYGNHHTPDPLAKSLTDAVQDLRVKESNYHKARTLKITLSPQIVPIGVIIRVRDSIHLYYSFHQLQYLSP